MKTITAATIVLLTAIPAAAQDIRSESSAGSDERGWNLRWDDHPAIEWSGQLRVELHARMQGDGRASWAAVAPDAGDGFDVGRRRIGIKGTVGKVLDFEIERELEKADPWRDAYVNYHRRRAVQIQAGLFKIPFGLEETTGGEKLDFIYRSLMSTRLAPGRDGGVMLHGRLAGRTLGYEVGVFAHDGDNARPNGGSRVFGGRTVAGRVTVEPFRRSKSALADLQAGMAFTHSPLPEGFPAIRGRSVLGVSFFDADHWVQGHRRRAGVQARCNLIVRNVGVRVRGLSSRSATKPGLRVDFNRYTIGQTFLGLESLALDNLVTDPALVRERVAMAFFARMGQPASRETFARLYLNNAYQGVYAIVESIDSRFLDRALGEKGGYLFERQFMGAFYGEDLGDDPAAYRTVFDPKNHELDADSILYGPIRDLFHEANQPVDTVWRERVGRHVDLEQFVTHVALETFLSENDGVLGFAGMANFYLYRDLRTGQHRFIVWDKDHTFTAVDSPILLRADENILFSRALAFDDLRALYLDTLERCARSAVEDDWLEAEIGRAAALVDAPAHEDVWKPDANDVYDAAVESLKRFARQRPAFVLQQVAQQRKTQ